MPCERFAGTILCRNRVYRYKGYYFDVHSYCGPTRLKKDDSAHQRPGKKFWEMYMEFEKLSAKQKQRYEVRHTEGFEKVLEWRKYFDEIN